MGGEPADDDRFVSVFAHALEHIGGYAPEEARRAARTLLPDVLSYDPTRPACFPSSGRTLTDDAGDAFVAVLTNGKVMEDKVGPHDDLLPEFPTWGRLTTPEGYRVSSPASLIFRKHRLQMSYDKVRFNIIGQSSIHDT
jgi:hypothetical protein